MQPICKSYTFLEHFPDKKMLSVVSVCVICVVSKCVCIWICISIFVRMLRSCSCGWFVGKTKVGQGQQRDNSLAANMLPIVVDIAIKFVFRVTECHQFLPPRTLNMIIMGKGQWSIFRKIDLKAFIIRTSIIGHQSLTIDNGNWNCVHWHWFVKRCLNSPVELGLSVY